MFTTALDLRDYLPGEWVLLAPMTWREGDEEIVVPRGFITDLASIPRALRGVLNVNGRSRKAAVLHDWGYCKQWASRAVIDALFRRALIAEGMHPLVARSYWLGVRAGGWIHWNARARRPINSKHDFAPTTLSEAGGSEATIK